MNSKYSKTKTKKYFYLKSEIKNYIRNGTNYKRFPNKKESICRKLYDSTPRSCISLYQNQAFLPRNTFIFEKPLIFFSNQIPKTMDTQQA